MSPLWVFLRGALLGFSIAAPVGPIGVLCIRRTLAEGRWIGLATGLGAAASTTLSRSAPDSRRAGSTVGMPSAASGTLFFLAIIRSICSMSAGSCG